MTGITKCFPGTLALDKVQLTCEKGKVHILLGENGAGKSTLMKIISGVYTRDEGTVWYDGQEVNFTNVRQSMEAGISMIHQELNLLPERTIAQNIYLGHEPMVKGLKGVIDYKKMVKDSRELMDRLGLDLDPNILVKKLSIAQMQMVEVVKALSKEVKLVIMDEPTSSLAEADIQLLYRIIRGLTAEGVAVIFISHKLNEIMAVADRVTVLRKGKCIGTVNTCDTNKQELSNMMVGRPVQLVIDKTPAHPGEEILHVEDLCVLSHLHKRNAVDHVSFNVRAGEIVCIAGIDGNGQTELIHGLTGLDKITGGSVTLCGETITHASIRRRGRNMSHIPEDRHKHGLVLDFTLEQNMVLQRYKEPQFQHGGFIRRDAVRAYADRLIEQFDVRSGQGAVTIARSMSGGNQQKAIIAREVDRDKPLIIAVQPTRGLDVGAIEYIHKQLVAQRDAGKAVLLVSLELDEVMSLSDRILVMYEGQIVGELDPKQTTVQELGLYMSGAKRSGKDGESA